MKYEVSRKAKVRIFLFGEKVDADESDADGVDNGQAISSGMHVGVDVLKAPDTKIDANDEEKTEEQRDDASDERDDA